MQPPSLQRLQMTMDGWLRSRNTIAWASSRYNCKQAKQTHQQSSVNARVKDSHVHGRASDRLDARMSTQQYTISDTTTTTINTNTTNYTTSSNSNSSNSNSRSSNSSSSSITPTPPTTTSAAAAAAAAPAATAPAGFNHAPDPLPASLHPPNCRPNR